MHKRIHHLLSKTITHPILIVMFYLANFQFVSCERKTTECKTENASGDKPGEAEKSDSDKTDPMKVQTLKVKNGQIYTPVVFGGFVKPQKLVPVYSEVDAIVKELKAKIGQRVEANQILMVLNPMSAGRTFNQYKLTAPLSGRLLNIDWEIGKQVNTQTPIAWVADESKLFVEIFVNYQDKLILSNDVNLKVVADPGGQFEKKVEGHLDLIAETTEPGSKSYKTRIEILCYEQLEREECLRLFPSGSFAKIMLEYQPRTAIMIPAKRLDSKNRVYVIKDFDPTKPEKEVSLSRETLTSGAALGDFIEIKSGLKIGDLIVENSDKNLRRNKTGIVTHIDGEEIHHPKPDTKSAAKEPKDKTEVLQ